MLSSRRAALGALARAFVFDLLVIALAVSAAIFGAAVTLSTAVGFSRTTSCGGLSSRTPLNAAWRTRPSAVQPRKFASITVLGSTQRISERRAFAPRGLAEGAEGPSTGGRPPPQTRAKGP